MKESGGALTRRDFLKGATFATLATTMGLPSESFAQEEESAKSSKVVLIRHAEVMNKDGVINDKITDEMIKSAMKELFQVEKAEQAWMHLFGPEDIVGIKSNVWGPLPTPSAVENSIVGGLMSAGVKEENIAIDDRGVLRNEVFKNANGYVNTRPMRTHHWSGVGGCLKNPIMFTPTPWSYHDNSCADLAKLWEIPILKDKIRLNILVMFTPLFHGVGAHHFNEEYTWRYNGLIVGTDPVAVDSTGLSILNAKRREYFGEDRPIKPPPHHIVFAEAKHKLGISDPSKIDLVKLGWKEKILI
jgi:hypothetical protein